MAEPAKNSQPAVSDLVKEIEELRTELARQRAGGTSGFRDVIKVTKEHAYVGLVRALEKGVYQHLRHPGEVFEVAVDALWDDDWYEPVYRDGEEVKVASIPRLPGARRPLHVWNDTPVRNLQKQIDSAFDKKAG